MDLVEVARAITEIDVEDASRADVGALLRHVTTLRRLADSVELAGNRRLLALAAEDPAISPEHANAEATQRRRLKRAHEAVKSAKAAEGCPFFADALARGEISLGHLEAFARGLRSLTKTLRPRLSEIEPSLVRIAARLCVEDFADRVRAEVRDIEGDDGKGRLEQQKRRSRAKSWTDKEGMWNLHAAFDPETGMILDEILRKVTEKLFRDGTPGDAPEDPQMKQEWLRAQALRMIMTGEIAVGRGETTIVVVTDDQTFTTGRRHARTRFDVNGVNTFPVELLAKYRERAKFVAALVDQDGKLISLGRKVRTAEELFESLRNPVNLDLGRARRTANGDQHLAKRVMYRTCAIPGCRVPSHHCELHHIHQWEHGGTTDIENLLPICPYHHDRIHADGWTLHLGPDRSLTIRKQGVTLMATGPPGEQWAQAA